MFYKRIMLKTKKILKKLSSTTPRVLEKMKGGVRSPFSLSGIYNNITPLKKPLRELRTGQRFIPRKEKILKERVLKNIIKDSYSDNMVLYHGTKSSAVPNIKKVGLIPRETHMGKVLYLTPNKKRAVYHAKKGTQVAKALKQPYDGGAVITVDIPDEMLKHYDLNEIQNTKYPFYDVRVFDQIPPSNIISIDILSKDKKSVKIFISKYGYNDAMLQAGRAGYVVVGTAKNKQGEYVVFGRKK